MRHPNCRYVHPDRMEARSNTVNCKCRKENSCFVHLDGKNPPPRYDFNPTQKTSTEHMSESNTLHDSGSSVSMQSAACNRFDCRDIHPGDHPVSCDIRLNCTLNDYSMFHPMSACPNARILCVCSITILYTNQNVIQIHTTKAPRDKCTQQEDCVNIFDCLSDHPTSRESTVLIPYHVDLSLYIPAPYRAVLIPYLLSILPHSHLLHLIARNTVHNFTPGGPNMSIKKSVFLYRLR